MAGRFTLIDGRLAALDQKVDALGGTIDEKFRWMMGGMITLVVAVIGAVITR